MKVVSLYGLKSNFSEALKAICLGKKFVISYKEVGTYLVFKQIHEHEKRKIGILDGTAFVVFKDDFKMTAEAFLGL